MKNTETYKDEIISKRTNQINWLILIAVSGNLIIDIARKAWISSSLLGITVFFLIGIFQLIKKRKQKLAAEILISGLTILVFSVIWFTGGGLYDLALLAVPSILIFSAILRALNIFKMVFFFSIANILLIGIFEDLGFVSFNISIHGTTRAVAILFIFVVTGIALLTLAKDYRELMQKLKDEIQNVNKTKDDLEYQAHHDPLTLLPNRALARDRFEHAKRLLIRQKSSNHILLIYIDLDDFKIINDSLGHEAGDRYLQTISQRLCQSVRDCDTVCRLGGDEFLIIIEGIKDDQETSNIAQNILATLLKPVKLEDKDISSGGSMGISSYPKDATEYDELVQKADIAMYRSKESGRNTFHYFNESMNQMVEDRINLLEDLKEALDKGQFFLAYQPIVDIKNNKIIGAEALIRWNHPERGLIPPFKFIPAAEKSGFIIELGTWILQQACRDLYFIQTNVNPSFNLAINVSSVQLQRNNFNQTVEEAMKDYLFTPGSLEIELTESGLITDSKEFQNSLEFLHAKNINLAIDDFGTGYSNLSYLKRIKAYKLKIDMSFVQGLHNDSENQSIVQTIQSLSEGLHLKSVAEGIETQEELEVIKRIGVNLGQGYLWSKPLPINDFMKLL